EQSRSELEQKLEAARQQQSEAESLRTEVGGLRGEAQSARQALERSRSLQSPSSIRSSTSVAADPAQLAPPLSDRNRALLEYIGEPVDPSLNTDSRYTKDSVLSAVQLAAQNAGVSLQRLEVEDSEYPCLVGVFCSPQDYARLLDEIKKLDGYEYNGAVGGSDSFHSLNITPARASPGAAKEQIDRRVMLRQQMFYKSLSAAR